MHPTSEYPYRADIHAHLIEIAARGSLIAYGELGVGRRMVGSYLFRIAEEEQAAGRPPLTAVVVHKVGGTPGPGFLEAAKAAGYWREGETEDAVWRRAVHDVHEYWRPKLGSDQAVQQADGPRSEASGVSGGPSTSRRSKYRPLTDHLKAGPSPIDLSFSEIDRIVGNLPPSARIHREWWANHQGSPQARGRLDAGRRVSDIDLGRETVRFS